MPTGIRAELAFEDAEACRLRSSIEGAEAEDISWSVSPGSGAVTEEFAMTGEHDVEGAEEVFAYGDRRIYRFQREGVDCPCATVESLDVPVRDVHTRNGAVHLAIYVLDMAELRAVITRVRSSFPEVQVVRIVRAAAAEDDLVLVDRSSLTDRQAEVLRIAHRMGYFDHPKGANAGEVAEELGITTSTFTEHLAAAQSKLLDSILD